MTEKEDTHLSLRATVTVVVRWAPHVSMSNAPLTSLTVAMVSVSRVRGGAMASETATAWRTRRGVPVPRISSPVAMVAAFPWTMSVTRASIVATSRMRTRVPAPRQSSGVTTARVSRTRGAATTDTIVET